MTGTADLLGLTAKRARVHALAAVGVLSQDQLERSLVELGLRPTRSSWTTYLYWHALIVGVVLLVAGTIFFVAANWSALSGLIRMGLVAGAMVTAILVGGWLGDTLTGRAVSLLGGLLFGPLLSVYGQVYQTGADAWELFAVWAAVLIGFAFLVRFVGTWVVALICVHIAWFTWIDQELGDLVYAGRNAWLVAGLALVDAAIVALAERWLDGRERDVVTHTAASFGLLAVLPFGLVTIIDGPPEGGLFGLGVLLAGLLAIWLVYRWRRPRLGMLVAFATVVTILATTLLGRILFEELDAELFGVALLGALVCGLVWLFTRWLLNWRHEHARIAPPQAKSSPRVVEPVVPVSGHPPMSLDALLGVIGLGVRIHDDPRVVAALHDSDGTDGPVIIRLFTAVGTWIGAAMLAVLVAALEIYEVVPLALVLGVGLLVGATALSRRSERSLAGTQVIWAMALGGQALLLGAMLELELAATSMAAIWTALNLVALFVVRVPSFQVASAVLTVGFATWFAHTLELPLYPLWVALPVAAIATAAWIDEVRWAAALGRTWSALAYGLPLGVVGPISLLNTFDATSWGPTLATLALVGLIGAVLLRAQVEQQRSGDAIERNTHIIGAIALLSVLAARHVPGVSLALLWLLLAQLRRSVGLQTIASIQLAGFLAFFYYQLETTLLLKSLWVISTGVVLLFGAWLGRTRTPAHGEHPARRSRLRPALALAVVTVGLVFGASAQKQRILATGQIVLLPLAPVDPRSLIQGDYMVLRYALEQEMGVEQDDFEPHLARHGRLVIAVDPDGVGHFARIDDGGLLAPNELRLEYRLRDGWSGRVRIGADSFLFEEGTGELYEGARFGELIVADDGEVVLVGLRDAERQPLGLRLH